MISSRWEKAVVVVFCSFLVFAGLSGSHAAAQPVGAEREAAEGENLPLLLSLDDAVAIALTRNYGIREQHLQVADADQQIREAWGQVLPQLDVSSGYTRDIISANPFAGSDALNLLVGGGMSDWVAHNERARTDDDPTTSPITYEEFVQRQEEARRDAGVRLGGGGNPFGVDNMFQAGITLSQTLYNGSAFAAIRGAQQLRDINARALDRQEQLLIQDVKESFFAALLMQQQARVALQSVERTRETLEEVRLRVTRGVTPTFDRLSTEVQLANLETDLVHVQNQYSTAADNLKMLLGLPVENEIVLQGGLDSVDMTTFHQVSFSDAIAQAMERRPDLQQARLAIELREIDQDISRSRYLPQVSAFASYDYIGRVPDNRTRTITDPMNPFFFDTEERGFFSSNYWNHDLSAGIQLTWNIFDGFQREAAIQQRQIAVGQAQIEYEQAQQLVYLDVQRAIREMESALQRIHSQERNVEQAQTNFRFASQRVAEGVSTQLELRDASQQLDQSQLNYYQAVHDYLVARSAYETAIGAPIEESPTLHVTRY